MKESIKENQRNEVDGKWCPEGIKMKVLAMWECKDEQNILKYKMQACYKGHR